MKEFQIKFIWLIMCVAYVVFVAYYNWIMALGGVIIYVYFMDYFVEFVKRYSAGEKKK